jgi:N6-L-threonylcarbamoyladenine synthase
MIDNKHCTLAIESSCDETSVAILLEGREVLSNIIASQISIHKAFGGVVPEIASRHHLENINGVVEQAFAEASEAIGSQVGFSHIDLIGVTKGPGLVGALLIGIATAKGFSLALDKPLVGVHHIQGHIAANLIEYPDLEPPFMALIVSGGHTCIVRVDDVHRFHVLGETRDDAIGEAYDKVARVLGLGYPGGPLVDQIAKEGNPEAVAFKRVFLDKDSMDFSFSGIKTGVLNYLHNEKQAGREVGSGQPGAASVADVAASFQQAVLDVVVAKTMAAMDDSDLRTLVLAGGVAANSKLRSMLASACAGTDIRLCVPAPVLCTDNAAMIGCAAYYNYKAGIMDDLTLDAYASLPLDNFTAPQQETK